MDGKPKVILLFENVANPALLLDVLAQRGFGQQADVRSIVLKAGESFDPRPFGPQSEQVAVLGTIWGSISSLKQLKQANPNISWVHTFTAGVDKLISPELRALDVVLTNSKGTFSPALAEFILFQLLWFEKQGLFWQRQKEQRVWQKHSNGNLAGKTVGIVGFGDIGGEIALRAKPFQVKVIGLKRDASKVDEKFGAAVDRVLGLDGLDELLSESDYVVNCLPLVEQTKHFFTLETFAKMKPTAIFMNIGRGPSVKESDLVTALQQKVIAGAFLDVFETEPLARDSPLWSMENVFLTPHSCDFTDTSWERIADTFLENFHCFAAGKPLKNIIDQNKGY